LFAFFRKKNEKWLNMAKKSEIELIGMNKGFMKLYQNSQKQPKTGRKQEIMRYNKSGIGTLAIRAILGKSLGYIRFLIGT